MTRFALFWFSNILFILYTFHRVLRNAIIHNELFCIEQWFYTWFIQAHFNLADVFETFSPNHPGPQSARFQNQKPPEHYSRVRGGFIYDCERPHSHSGKMLLPKRRFITGEIFIIHQLEIHPKNSTIGGVSRQRYVDLLPSTPLSLEIFYLPALVL